METKICKSCKKQKDIKEFRFIRQNKNGTFLYKARCEDCYNYHYREKYRKKSSTERSQIYKKRIEGLSFEDKKSQRLKYRFGLTMEEYENMLLSQNNKCYLCDKDFKGKGAYQNANIDHDHKTGKIRKLLCARCNQALGLLDEDENLLKKMVVYLREHNVDIRKD